MADGDHDSAVSHAYYAMFYLAEALLLKEDLSFSKHSAVIAGFGREFAKTGKVPEQYHAFLKEAEEDRITADYMFTSELSYGKAEQHIARAEQFLATAEQHLRDA